MVGASPTMRSMAGNTGRYGLLRTDTDCSCRQAANWQHAVCCLSSNVRLSPFVSGAQQGSPITAGGSGFVSLRRDKQYCEQLASFTRKEPRDPASFHYAATRHTFVCDPASFHYAVKSRTVRRYTTPWRAILRGKVAFCKANKRGSILLYVTERFAAARREISRKIACLKYGIRR